MVSTHEWLIAVMVFGTLVATGVAAYYTKRQWETAADYERRSLRAYMGLYTDVPIKLHCDSCSAASANKSGGLSKWDDNFISITIKNFGQTPAYRVHIHTNYLPVPL